MRHREFGRRRAMRVSVFAAVMVLAGAVPTAAKQSSNIFGAAGASPSSGSQPSPRSGVWHVIEPDRSVGPLLADVFEWNRTAGSEPEKLLPGGCPQGTTNYFGLQYPYSCRNVFLDSKGDKVVLRIGYESVGGRIGNDGDQPEVKGFGLVHAQEDHNVGPHSIALIVADAPPQANKESSYPSRFLYQIGEIVVPGEIVETLNVVVQKAPDQKGIAPDKLDFGVITAFCSAGTGRPGDPGYCSNDLPPLFNGGAGN